MDGFFTPGQDSFQRDCHGNFDVFPLLRGRSAAEQTIEQSRVAEVEVQSSEIVVEIDASEQVLGRKAGNSRVAAAVILSALLGVT